MSRKLSNKNIHIHDYTDHEVANRLSFLYCYYYYDKEDKRLKPIKDRDMAKDFDEMDERVDEKDYSLTNRMFFKAWGNDKHIYSIYRCFFKHVHNLLDHPKFAVILINTHGFVAGLYTRTILETSREFHCPPPPGADNDKIKEASTVLRKQVEMFLKEWKEHLDNCDFVLVKCPKYFKNLHFDPENVKKPNGTTFFKYQPIPMPTGLAFMEELSRIVSQLFTIVDHGPKEQFNQEVFEYQQNLKSHQPSTPSTSSSKGQRRLEKQQFPSVSVAIKRKLHETVLHDDGDQLEELLLTSPDRLELIEYVNCPHDHLNGLTFLHLAVQKDLLESAEVLLQNGSDPTVSDEHGKKAFEYCMSDQMKSVFVQFKQQNNERFNWNKSAIVSEEGGCEERKKSIDTREKRSRRDKEKKAKERSSKKVYMD